jgi:hypothetical protein
MCSPPLGELSFREGISQGVHAAAHALARLEHGDLKPVAHELVRSGEPSEPRSHHCNPCPLAVVHRGTFVL